MPNSGSEQAPFAHKLLVQSGLAPHTPPSPWATQVLPVHTPDVQSLLAAQTPPTPWAAQAPVVQTPDAQSLATTQTPPTLRVEVAYSSIMSTWSNIAMNYSLGDSCLSGVRFRISMQSASTSYANLTLTASSSRPSLHPCNLDSDNPTGSVDIWHQMTCPVEE